LYQLHQEICETNQSQRYFKEVFMQCDVTCIKLKNVLLVVLGKTKKFKFHMWWLKGVNMKGFQCEIIKMELAFKRTGAQYFTRTDDLIKKRIHNKPISQCQSAIPTRSCNHQPFHLNLWSCPKPTIVSHVPFVIVLLLGNQQKKTLTSGHVNTMVQSCVPKAV
jgi:hypothetical protein